jgi:hypothetical protein
MVNYKTLRFRLHAAGVAVSLANFVFCLLTPDWPWWLALVGPALFVSSWPLYRQRRTPMVVIPFRSGVAPWFPLFNYDSYSFLCSLLDDENQEALKQRGFITVKGSRGGDYRVTIANSGNVFQLHDGITFARYCAVFSDRHEDVFAQMIAQKFLLETDERKFKKIAMEY